jgi:MoxR-like ATPase
VATGQLHAALSGVLLGRPGAVTFAVVAALSGGHLLIEDVPGVGKTVLARALALGARGRAVAGPGPPDLLPSDITGVTVYDQRYRRRGTSGPGRCSATSCCSTSSTAPRRAPSRPCSRPWTSSR